MVKNRFYFTNLKKYKISYTLKANGKAIKSGQTSLDIQPQGCQSSCPDAEIEAESRNGVFH